MKLIKTELPGVILVQGEAFSDDRGWFMESFNEARWEAAMADLGEPAPRRFVQDNHSCSRAGVVRGLHYQLNPHAQGKLVRVVQGRAFDVAVDIRKGSSTFGSWFGTELSAANGRQMWIPEGYAHGFLALEDNTHFLYKTTDVYSKSAERAIHWRDPDIGIVWPALQGGLAFNVSDKDLQAPTLRLAETF